MRKIIVAGIGTAVGKTITSAILVEALNGAFWKPIQCGCIENSDTEVVKSLVSSKDCVFHTETYRLKAPLSPHHASELEGFQINPEKIELPQTQQTLIIEACGGIMVPINKKILMIDLLCTWNAEWIIVSRHYLGSINHTLLTSKTLEMYGVNVLGIIFNGHPNPHTEDAILSFTALRSIGRIFPEKNITPKIVKKYAQKWGQFF